MATITIHYGSPLDDPFKVPRPHRIRIDEQGHASEVEGGEIGPVGYLLGFSPTVTPDVDDWQLTLVKRLYDGEVAADELVGQYPQFTGGGFNDMFGYSAQVESIEVTS